MKRKRWISVCIAAALMITGIFTTEKAVARAAETVDTSELENQKQDTLDKIKDIKSELNAVKGKIESLKNSKSSLQSYIVQLDKEANALQTKIQVLKKDIEAKEAEEQA